MVSALGPDVVSACAAARAGISRAASLGDYSVWDSELCAESPVTVHEIGWLTRGFSGFGRLVRLGASALEDLCASSDPSSWGRVGVVLNLTSHLFFAKGVEKECGEGPAVAVLRKKIQVEIAGRRARLEAGLIPTLATLANLAIDRAAGRLIFDDETGLIGALDQARLMIESGQIDVCIVGGIDSQIEIETLAAFQTLGVLKTPDFPVGRIPGEGAAVLLVETARGARRRGVEGSARLHWSPVAREPKDRFEAPLSGGGALLSCLFDVLRGLPPNVAQPRLVIADLNGEELRALEWGYAMVRLGSQQLIPAAAEWYPALHFGTIGAAAGPVGICMACRGFARNYAGAETALMWLFSDSGARGALCIERVRA